MNIVCSLPRFVTYLLVFGQCVAAGQWEQVGLDIDGENELDFAGGTEKAVAMNGQGTTIAVGSSGHDGGGDGAGHVRVFDLIVGLWVQRGADIQGEFAQDNSGSTVVLSNDGLVVGIGEPLSDAGNTAPFKKDYGQVRIFRWNGGEWVQLGQAITGVDVYNYASAGGGLAMDASGSMVAIGAAEYNLNGLLGRNQGHVRVFDWDGTSWVQRGNDMIGEAPGDWFGEAVAASASGNTVAVGALFNDADAEDGPFGCVICRGSVRVFDWNANSEQWLQRGNDMDGEQDNDFSGSSVALNAVGDVVVIGSPQSSSSSSPLGSVIVYEYIGSDWVKRGARIEGEEVGDVSGSSVVISASGDTIAIGAYLNNGSSDTEGHARVFDWDGETWVQRGDDIDGENTFDYSGYALAMSADGNRLASGARFTDDGGGYFAGHVRVFGWQGNCAVNEDPNQTIVGILNENTEIFATCGLLSENQQFIQPVCSLDPAVVAEALSPAVRCPKTCGDPNASESLDTLILGLLGGTNVRRGTCGTVASLPQNIKDIACSLDETIWYNFDASIQCQCTCGQ